MGKAPIAGVEQWVLLAVLRLSNEAVALDVLAELDRAAGHVVSRGALYKTLERLEAKGLLSWTLEAGSPARGGHPRRRFTVTPAGLDALRQGRARLLSLWNGIEPVLEQDG